MEKQVINVVSSSDEYPINSEICEILRRLSDLPAEARGRQGLRIAARLVEFSAFESAGRIASSEIGELIDIAADLERRCDIGKKQHSGAIAWLGPQTGH